MTNRRNNLHRILFLLLVAVAGVFLCSYVGINLFRYTVGIDSDVAAEGLTARAMWVHGTIIPEEFLGSTETRIFNVNLIAAGVYGLTGNMNLSMGIACSIMMVLLIGSYVVLLRQLQLKRVSIAVAVVLLLAAPVTLRHAQLLYVQAVYYAIHSVLMLVTLTMWLHVMHEAKGWLWRMLVSCVLAFLISLSGMRAMLIYVAPLFVLVLLGWIASVLFYEREQMQSSSWTRSIVFVVATAAAASAGTYMPTSVSVGTTRNIRHGFFKLLETVIPETLECVGVGEQTAVRNVLLYVLLIATVVSIVWTMADTICKTRMSTRSVKNTVSKTSNSQTSDCIESDLQDCNLQIYADRAWILAFMIVSLGTSMLMAAFTTTESVWRYYYMIWFVLSYALALLIERFTAEREGRATALGPVMALIVVVYGLLVWKGELLPTLQTPVYNEDYAQIVSWMEENDYYYGYSTFETSNAMTGYCNGAVQVSAVADLGQMDICKWLTDKTWYGPYVPADTRTAYIIPMSMGDAFAPMRDAHADITLELETENYYVYVSPTNYSWQ